jgi:hypothetical protein
MQQMPKTRETGIALGANILSVFQKINFVRQTPIQKEFKILQKNKTKTDTVFCFS